METVVERHVVALGFRTDRRSLRTATGAMSAFTVGVASAVAASLGFTISQSAIADEVTKTAHDLGMATEAYTALAHVMGHDGVASEQLGGSLRYLQTQLEAAARGTGEALPWFTRMGIEATDAAGGIRLASDVLPELADGLSKLSEGDLRGASLRTLGENGLRMGRSLSKGSEALREMQKDAKRLRIVLSEDAGRASEELTDSMTDLQAAVSGLGMTFAGEIAPYITPIVEDLTDFLTASDGIVQSGLDASIDGVTWALERLDTPAGRAAAALGGIAAVGTGAGVAAGLLPMLGPLGVGLGGLVAPLGAAATAAAPLALALAGLALVTEDLHVASQGGKSATLAVARAMGVEKEAVAGLSATFDMLDAASGPVFGLMQDTGVAAVDALRWGMTGLYDMTTGLVRAFVDLNFPMRQFFNWLDYDSFDDLPLVKFLRWVAGPEFDPARGFRELGAWRQGSENVKLRGPEGSFRTSAARIAVAAPTFLAGRTREANIQAREESRAIASLGFGSIGGIGAADTATSSPSAPAVINVQMGNNSYQLEGVDREGLLTEIRGLQEQEARQAIDAIEASR